LRSADTRLGLGLSFGIALAWLVSLLALLRLTPPSLPLSGLVLVVLGRTLLQTGLFIVAHDAMHGSLLPGRPRFNDRLGQLALLLYACLPYHHCRANHRRHHQAPGTALDPDFRAGDGGPPWFVRFMGGYLSWPQMTALLSCWAATGLLLGTALPVLLFWTLPLLLSSLQLFFFGTVLPHRHGVADGLPHQPRSLDWPLGLSLLACYHFGYHREHHEAPTVPWFRLPGQRPRRGGQAPDGVTERIAAAASLAAAIPSR
jgi:beta-carotene ketolase (CrtW type)